MTAGGETPIGSSLEIFNKVAKEIPQFIQELKEKVVMSFPNLIE